MKAARWGSVLIALLSAAVLISMGCSKKQQCTTSLVTLDETRLDAETYEQEAAETARNAADLEQRLTQKKNEIAAIKDKPAELRKKVEELKKGSGRE